MVHSTKSLSRVQLLATLWSVARQAPLSIRFSWQEYRSGLPFPPPGYLLDPGIETASPALQADSLPLSHWGKPGVSPILPTFSNGFTESTISDHITITY